LFYSKDTYYTLNYLTLSVKDKEVERAFIMERAKSHNVHYKKLLVLTILLVTANIFLYFSDRIDLIVLVQTSFTLIFMMVWGLMRQISPRHTPHLALFYVACSTLFIASIIYRMWPDSLTPENMWQEEHQIMLSAICLS
jgi:hypothetical protein